jgi:hypothetical protein
MLFHPTTVSPPRKQRPGKPSLARPANIFRFYTLIFIGIKNNRLQGATPAVSDFRASISE